VVVAFYLAVRASSTISVPIWALLGVSVGLAVASKITGAMLAAVVLAAAWVLWYRTTRLDEGGERRRFIVEDVVTGLAIVGVMGFLTFRLAQPYAFAGPGLFNVGLNPKYLADVQTWQQFATGAADYPPSHQWAGATPYVWQLQNMTLWGLGPTFALAAWLGFILAAIQLARNPSRYYMHVFCLVWVGLNFAYWGVQFAKPMRYLLPIYPQLAILAAFFLVEAWRWARSGDVPSWLRLKLGPGARRGLVTALTVAVVGWTLFYAVAFAGIYTRTTTRVAASEWMYDNLPPNSRIGWEHWDDPLPLRVGGRELAANFRGVEFPMYDADNVEKRE
jgi:hypothetical protein